MPTGVAYLLFGYAAPCWPVLDVYGVASRSGSERGVTWSPFMHMVDPDSQNDGSIRSQYARRTSATNA